MRYFSIVWWLTCAALLAWCWTPVVDDSPSSVSEWNIVEWAVADNDEITQVLTTFESSDFWDEHYAIVPWRTIDQKFTNAINLHYKKTEAYAADSIDYVIDQEDYTYEFPYAKVNKMKLWSPECGDATLYDTILCYMPRVDWFYGVFDGVFATWKQLVYTISAYWSLSEQRVLDLESQREFPLMDTLYLLYFSPTNNAVVATVRGTSSLYNGLMIFSQWKKQSIASWPIDSVFFDGKHIYITRVDYTTELSSVEIVAIGSGETVAFLDNLQLGERAQFYLSEDTQTLYAYYVDVSFVEEKEFFYIRSIHLQDASTHWLVQLNK